MGQNQGESKKVAALPVQVSSSSDIPSVLSGMGNLPGAPGNDTARSLHESSLIPRSALNPAYEYALPTQVARLMEGPCARSEHVGTHGLDNASQLRSISRGCRESSPWLHSPMVAAAHPPDTASLRSGSLHIKTSHSSGDRGGSLRESNSAPVYSSCPGGRLQESLGAHSTDSGNTIIISPYMLTDCRTCMMTHATYDQSAVGSTRESTRTWDSAEPPSPSPQREVYGIHIGGPRDTFTTLDSAATQEVKRGMQRPWWQRMWPRPSLQTLPDDCTVDSVQSTQQLMTRAQRQLDAFRGGHLFLERFEMLGAQNRRRGGALPVISKLYM